MQIVADVLNMPIKVARSEQACALGSAMAAAVVAGVYPNTAEARKKWEGAETEITRFLKMWKIQTALRTI